uniref:Hexosyltransferase n=1 Tax=Kryptoperidinium triquetrum TaxID=66468 RepID=A8I1R9_KRYTR|nr:unknown [Heterocapsa triquetra]ABV72543.1 unknown [Heterocapsa triquetra]
MLMADLGHAVGFWECINTATQRKRLSRQRSLPRTASRVLVLLTDDRDAGYLNPLRALNQLWAKKHGYNYIFVNVGSYSRVPPWWRKVFWVRDACRKYTTVNYLDSDAVWHDPSAPLQAVAESHGTKTLLAGIHIGKGSGDFKLVEVNAGVYIAHGRMGADAYGGVV